MSVEISARVWKHSQSRGSHRLVLLAIADMADMEGEAYPGVTRLAEMVRLKPRQVQNILRDLEASGELETAYQSSKWGTNVYRVTVATGVQQSAPPRCSRVHPPGAAECTPPVQQSAPDPSVDPLDDPLDDPSGALARPRRGKVRITPEDRIAIIEAFSDLANVDDRIDAALNHVASRKAIDLNLYVRTWLRKDRERSSNGNGRAYGPQRVAVQDSSVRAGPGRYFEV